MKPFFVRCNIKTPSAKHISSKIARRRLEHALGWDSDRYIFYVSWTILIIVSIIFAVIIFNWTGGIKPPSGQPDIEVSVTKIGQNRLEVMIIYIERDVPIEYLTYSTPRGSGFINRSDSPKDPIRDAGEYGIIPGTSGNLEIRATLAGGKTIKIYDGIVS